MICRRPNPGPNCAQSLGNSGFSHTLPFHPALSRVSQISCPRTAGDFWVAGVGSAFTFLVLLLFGRVKNDDRLLLIIRAARVNEEKIEALVFLYYSRKANLRVKNTTETAVEFIYELSRRTADRAEKASKGGARKSITDALYEIGSIEYCNLVMQNDEISS